ncbi:MAG: carbohydrate porin [Acidobacteriota bacterium]
MGLLAHGMGLMLVVFLALALPGLQSQALPPAATAPGRSDERGSRPKNPILNAKSTLEKHGITFSGWLQLDGSTVAAGGQPNAIGFDGQDLLDVTTTVDTKQLLGWPGGTFMIDVQSHNGPSILRRQMPALQDPDNMDAYQQTSVDRAWFQQDLLSGKVQARVGVMYVDDQYFTVPYGQNFVSLNFSSDASISTFVLPTFPKGAFGGDVFVYPVKGLSLSGGMWNDHATELSYDPGGDLYVTEEGWQSAWRGRTYKVQVGAWRDTGRFRRFAGGITHDASGEYAVASQKWWQPRGSSDRGLGTFFQFGTGPPAVAAVRRHYGAGVVWTGPMSSRPHDEIGLAFSDSLLTAQTNFTHGFENEIEAYYQIAAWKGLTVQPDVEYWLHPGGMSTPNTVLALTRIMYTF